ncbi:MULTISPECIES: phasin family protein [Sphingomonas]|uniref:phasin family protein n=1 Tax=Sphingomonas TaxID=13687 RepID=UPI0024137C68|nr:phasin family protein [Sphingomonas echinoides]
MATKGPKSVASKRIVKPVVSGANATSDSPPVPFVAHPAPIVSAPKLTPKRGPVAKSAPLAVQVPVEPAKPVAAAAPATPAVAQPVSPPPAEKAAEPAVAPVAAPVVSASDEIPTPSTTPAISPPATSTPAIAPATAIMQKDTSTMDATINTAAETAQTQATTMFADVNDRAKTAMEKGSKMIAELSEFSKGNLEAVVESSKIAAKGAEDIARYTSDYVRTSVEKANTTASQFASIKSPTEFFKLHSEMTKQAMDSMMAETAKFTEGYVKLLGEIAQPISNRVAVAVEKVKVVA